MFQMRGDQIRFAILLMSAAMFAAMFALARWLLMSQDRSYADSFRVTHEFLSFMLGVRRVGITTAAATLQRQGLVKYHRGDITVLNRQALKAAACSCYESDRKAYAELLH